MWGNILFSLHVMKVEKIGGVHSFCLSNERRKCVGVGEKGVWEPTEYQM